MSYSVSDLKQDVVAMFHGTTSNQIVNFNALINRGARDVLLDCDPQETKRITQIGQVFNSVYDYSVPDDLKQNRVIDIFPQTNRQLTDIWLQVYNQPFDVNKKFSLQDQFTILFNGMVKTARINAPTLTPPTVINDCESTNGNGAWSVGGNATGLTSNSIYTAAGGGSLQFNLSAGINPSTGYLENSTMAPLDLSAMENQGTLFLWTYFPTALNFTNVILRWGSSSADYWQVTATTTQANTTFQDGWNLLSFAWLGATVVGSPDSSDITYARVTWTYDGTAQTAVYLDQITAAMGTILNMEYYSRYMFRSATTGAFQERVTADSNLINLEWNDLLLYKCCELTAQQLQGADALQYDGKFFSDQYTKTLQRYNALFKSEIQSSQVTYYAMPQPGRSQWPLVRRGF